MAEVLFVDDEPGVLRSIERLFISHDRSILTASSGAEALQLLAEREVAVLVSDQRMPQMTGTELVTRVKQEYPNTVRIILSAYSDLSALMEAINRGEIYRFLVKPWQDDELLQAVDEGLSNFQYAQRSRRVEEGTMLALAQTIELKDPYTGGHCDRVARYAVGMARALALSEPVIRAIKYGAWLHDCGKIGVPEEVLGNPGMLSSQQFDVVKRHPEWGAEVARKARLDETVVKIIRFHHERLDGEGYPLGLRGEEIPLEARIVAVADNYDALSSDRPYRKACGKRLVEKIMRSQGGSVLDAELIDLLLERVAPEIEAEIARERQDDGTG